MSDFNRGFISFDIICMKYPETKVTTVDSIVPMIGSFDAPAKNPRATPYPPNIAQNPIALLIREFPKTYKAVITPKVTDKRMEKKNGAARKAKVLMAIFR
ncbi:hypothetical protein WH50_11535 [Pokkaliibacter plantistimulans]|uniref:Uncharacterized protein n=2 Tax=Pokkaliibacter plantistimulans TaxID=1635171 RepID=A0ABX5M0A2_9GAMM|nr:hypothetical protein WH50_11535 [Pokkaliibacter plantistimulans]